MSQDFLTSHSIRWKDIDKAGVLNNAVYLTIVEQARYHYFGSLGLIEDDDFPFLLGTTTARYLAPGRTGSVSVESHVTRIGGKSLDMSYAVQQNETMLAQISATLVWVDANLRSIRVPDHARRSIGAREERSFLPG